jgi:hypothetical protein
MVFLLMYKIFHKLHCKGIELGGKEIFSQFLKASNLGRKLNDHETTMCGNILFYCRVVLTYK